MSTRAAGGHRRGLAAVAAALVLVASAACGGGDGDGGSEPAAPAAPYGGGGGGATSSEGAVSFVAADIRYEDAPEQVEPGSRVFELVNEGALPHTVTIEELDDRTVVATDAGETATGEVELEPGTYTYYCSVPGHREAGMEGTLEVTQGAG